MSILQIEVKESIGTKLARMAKQLNMTSEALASLVVTEYVVNASDRLFEVDMVEEYKDSYQ